MAIVLEQEKKATNWFYIVTTIVIVGLLLAAVYYLFLARPELIEVALPAPLTETSALSDITFDPQRVLNEASFKALKQYATEPTPGEVGRVNPFLPF